MMQDPKEATRERIERLKKEGAVEFEEASNDKGAIPPPKVPVLKQGRAAASEVSDLLTCYQSDAVALGCSEPAERSVGRCVQFPGINRFHLRLHSEIYFYARGVHAARPPAQLSD